MSTDLKGDSGFFENLAATDEVGIVIDRLSLECCYVMRYFNLCTLSLVFLHLPDLETLMRSTDEKYINSTTFLIFGSWCPRLQNA